MAVNPVDVGDALDQTFRHCRLEGYIDTLGEKGEHSHKKQHNNEYQPDEVRRIRITHIQVPPPWEQFGDVSKAQPKEAKKKKGKLN